LSNHAVATSARPTVSRASIIFGQFDAPLSSKRLPSNYQFFDRT
jgi:hypothetical protein